jgi:hypothetical protein
MSSKIIIDNAGGSITADGVEIGGGGSLPTPTETGSILVSNSSNQYVAHSPSHFMRNRIINGAMMVDQRNQDRMIVVSGASYNVDRWVASGISPYGAHFDGSGDMISVNGSTAVYLNGDFTIEMWIKQDTIKLCCLAAYARVSGTTYAGWVLKSTVNGALTFEVNTANSAGIDFELITANGVMVANVWTHVALTRSGNNFYIFVNGVQVASGSSTAVPWNTGTTYGIGIGGAYSGSWGTGSVIESVDGYISNFRIVKGTALYTANFTPPRPTLSVVSGTSLLVCAASTFVDLSANNYAVTVKGDTFVTTETPSPFLAGRNMGWSNSFDGSGDYLSVADNAAFQMGLLDLTVEAWVNLPSLGTSGSVFAYSDAAGTVLYQINIQASSFVRAAIRSSSGNLAAIQSNSAISANTWYHLACVRRSGTLYLYVNGVQQTATLNASAYNLGSGGIPSVGSLRGTVDYFNGYISNVRIVKGTSLYSTNFTPQTSPLIPVANTSLLTCASEAFNDKSSNNFTVTPTGNVAVSSLSPFSNQAPAGFISSLRWSVTNPDTAGGAEGAEIIQRIEGTSIYDLAWGTASAKPVTLSFWVRSAIPGTYCVSLRSTSPFFTYVAEYTISSANTWEKKNVQISGPTVGTWSSSTSIGAVICFDLGSGTNYNNSPGVWHSGVYSRTTSQTNFIGAALVSGAQSNDFCITGAQLEAGQVATPFEARPIQVEIALCQRYYTKMKSLSGNYVAFGTGPGATATNGWVFSKNPVTMRTTPVITQSNTSLYDTTARAVTAINNYYRSEDSALLNLASSGITAQRSYLWCGNNNPNAYVEFDAEL